VNIYSGDTECWLIARMVVIAESEAHARQIMDQAQDVDPDELNPGDPEHPWLDREVSHVVLLGRAAPDWNWARVVATEAAPY
jgi:hypothetical protein